MVGIQYVSSIYADLLRIEGYDEYGGGGSLSNHILVSTSFIGRIEAYKCYIPPILRANHLLQLENQEKRRGARSLILQQEYQYINTH